MDELADRFADFLEEQAQKVRSMTVDNLDRVVTIIALGILLVFLTLIALIFLNVALFRIVANYATVEGAYAIYGGLFVVAGAFVWVKRKPHSTENHDRT